jgi:hypothetical protein
MIQKIRVRDGHERKDDENGENGEDDESGRPYEAAGHKNDASEYEHVAAEAVAALR